jgi:hypothetical protein
LCAAATWKNVAEYVGTARSDYAGRVRGDVSGWVGSSGDAYRSRSATHRAVLEGIPAAANGISYAVQGAGLLVGMVRGIVRDLIAQFVATRAAGLPECLAEEGLTLGIGTPVVIAQVAALVAKWVGRIQGFIRALLNSPGKFTEPPGPRRRRQPPAAPDP